MVCHNAYVGATCQSNIHVDGRTHGLPAEHCPKHQLRLPASLSPIVHPGAVCSPGNAHAPDHSCDVKENVVHQTRPFPSISPWSNSDAHVTIVGTFGSGSFWQQQFLAHKFTQVFIQINE